MSNFEQVEGSQNLKQDTVQWAQQEVFNHMMQAQVAGGNLKMNLTGDTLDFGDSSALYKGVLAQAIEPSALKPGSNGNGPQTLEERRDASPHSLGPDRRAQGSDVAPSSGGGSSGSGGGDKAYTGGSSSSRDDTPNGFGPERRNPSPNWNRESTLLTDETYYSLSNISDDTSGLLRSSSSKLITLDKDTSVQDVAKQLLGADATVEDLAKMTQKIAGLNGITDVATVLKKGGEIRVPTKESEQTKTKEHEVKPGESLWKIAAKELGPGATTKDIIKLVNEIIKLNANKLPNPDHIEPGDKLKLPGDKTKVEPSKDRNLEAEKLDRKAQDAFKGQPEKLAQFRENMKQFEERAKKDGLPPQEVEKTYREVGRLFDAQGDKPISKDERNRLAEQVIRQAASPTSIDQGQHNTCNMNTVEVRTYSKNPSEAAKLVADVATTGQYTTKDGKTIKVDPKPHHESTYAKPSPGDRSYASEIFQVTAVNIHLEMENRKYGTKLRYEQGDPVPGKPGNGERLLDDSTNPPKEVGDDPRVNTGNLGNLRDVFASITGKREREVVVGHADWVNDRSDGVKRVHTEKEFHDYLAQCKRDGKFPITVGVDTTNEPFWSDSGGGTAGGSGGGHVVNITDYEPGPPARVAIDNSWGPRADHDGRSPISVHDLYMSMRNSRKSVEDMRGDVEWNRKNGTVDHWKEFELLRLERNTGKISDAQYEQKLTEAMRQAKKDWEGKPDSPEQRRSKEKLNNLVENLDGPAKFRVLREERKIGLISDSDYDKSLARFADTARRTKESLEKAGLYTPDMQKEFNESIKELEESLKGLPADRVKKIREEFERLKKS